MKIAASAHQAAHFVQVAALPLKIDDTGTARMLVLTSRGRGHWIIPKGWPMKGCTPAETAAREALEEAGLVGRPTKTPIGTYSYFKRRLAHLNVCQVDVYLLKVEKQLSKWREKGQREARWVTFEEAASLIQEPGLVAIIRNLASEQLAQSL